MTTENLEKLADDFESENDKADPIFHLGLKRGFIDGYRKGQLNPEIKKLKWEKNSTQFLGENIDVLRSETIFCEYKILVFSWGCVLCIVDSTVVLDFKTVDEAIEKAQKYFDNKVMECIETDDNSKNH